MIDRLDFAYYGRVDCKKPKQGIVYYMLDEHIKNILSKRGDEFKIEMVALFSRFKAEYSSKVKELVLNVKCLEKEISALKKSGNEKPKNEKKKQNIKDEAA